MDMQVVKTKMGVGPKKGQIQYTVKRVSYADVTSEAILDEIKQPVPSARQMPNRCLATLST